MKMNQLLVTAAVAGSMLAMSAPAFAGSNHYYCDNNALSSQYPNCTNFDSNTAVDYTIGWNGDTRWQYNSTTNSPNGTAYYRYIFSGMATDTYQPEVWTGNSTNPNKYMKNKAMRWYWQGNLVQTINLQTGGYVNVGGPVSVSNGTTYTLSANNYSTDTNYVAWDIVSLY